MIVSMTGYGRSLKENNNYQVTVEMKAVNHRFCEINIRMPRQFFFIEDQLKKVIGRYISRGKVDVFINLNGEGIVNRKLSVDWDLVDQYFETFEKMSTRYTSPQNFPLETLILHENVVDVQESDDASEGLTNMVVSAAEEAVKQLREMREKEGNELHHDLHTRIDNLAQRTADLKENVPNVQKNYREKLTKRVQEFVAGTMEIDESRILTEVAVYADKADIQEEITRIMSHVKQFNEILTQGKVVGRKLDFIVQELNREINTIGSKANDILISQNVVNLKSELEKIREQVQNIE